MSTEDERLDRAVTDLEREDRAHADRIARIEFEIRAGWWVLSLVLGLLAFEISAHLEMRDRMVRIETRMEVKQ